MMKVAVLINARTKSTRLPRKLVRPFAGMTLIDIALEKLAQMDFVSHRYFAAAEDELIDRAKGLPSIQILRRDLAAVAPGYNDHRLVFAHYERVDADYIVWMNPCHPLLSLGTLRRAVEHVLQTRHNSYTSTIPTTDWIFDDSGLPVTNTSPSMLSTDHSRRFFKVAHAFHVIRKEFFLKNYQYWTLTRNDPALIDIPVEESYDVNTQIEFDVAEAAYRLARDEMRRGQDGARR
jgi:CMP-N-acetylneuraminic acid synthetase